MCDRNSNIDSREGYSEEIEAAEMLYIYDEMELDELWSESSEEEEFAAYYDEFENTFDLYDGE